MNACPTDHPALPALFDPQVPNNPVLWAVLKGRHSGKAVVDDLQNPIQCVLRTDALLTFYSRQISQAFLNEAIAHFRALGPIWLVWPATSSLHPPDFENVRIVQRLEFFGYDPQSRILTDLRRQLPPAYRIRTTDRQLLNRCKWRDEMAFYCGSVENFLANGIGLCMMLGDEIIVEAYASSLGDTRAEIGAITREAYRGRGYAPITCAYLIDACEQKDFHAYWSCDQDNTASIRVAQKLGFQHERAYQILGYKSCS